MESLDPNARNRIIQHFQKNPREGISFYDVLENVMDVLDLPILEIASSLLQWNPANRPSAYEVLEDPFLSCDYRRFYHSWNKYSKGMLPPESQGLLKGGQQTLN